MSFEFNFPSFQSRFKYIYVRKRVYEVCRVKVVARVSLHHPGLLNITAESESQGSAGLWHPLHIFSGPQSWF